MALETFTPRIFGTNTVNVEVHSDRSIPIMLSPDNEEEGCKILLTTHFFISDVIKLACFLATEKYLGDKLRIRITDQNWGKVYVKQDSTEQELHDAIFATERKG